MKRRQRQVITQISNLPTGSSRYLVFLFTKSVLRVLTRVPLETWVHSSSLAYVWRLRIQTYGSISRTPRARAGGRVAIDPQRSSAGGQKLCGSLGDVSRYKANGKLTCCLDLALALRLNQSVSAGETLTRFDDVVNGLVDPWNADGQHALK